VKYAVRAISSTMLATVSGGFAIDALASKSAKVKQACRFVKKPRQPQRVTES
jgi:hypothetical protein